ncbi:MAG: HAMP domain-containing sensor histidine kinase [bacterium]|nr:HAMP domain-containing sensor histidine kinase [bacterium]
MSRLVRFLMRSNRAFYGLLAVVAIIVGGVIAVFHVKLLPMTPELYDRMYEQARGDACAYGIMSASDYVNDVFLPHIESLEALHPTGTTLDCTAAALGPLKQLPGVRRVYNLSSEGITVSGDEPASAVLTDSLIAKRELFRRCHLGGDYGSPKFLHYTLNRVRFTNLLMQRDTLRLILCAYDSSGSRIISVPKSDSTLAHLHNMVALEMDPQWIRQAVAAQMERVFYEREAFMLWSPGIPSNYEYWAGLGVLAFGDTLWWKGLKSVNSGTISDWMWPNHTWFSYRSVQEDDADSRAETDKEIGARQIPMLFADVATLVISVLLILTLILVRKQWLARQTALEHLAHAVRSPVARLRLNVDTLLERRSVSPEQESEILAAVGAECGKIERAVRNAAFSLEEGKRRSVRERDDLNRIVTEVLASWQSGFRSAGVMLSGLASPEPLNGEFDRERVSALLDNLLDNALRHTRLRQQRVPNAAYAVTVELHREGSDALLSVSDMGDGVAEADQQRIFRRFARGADTALTGASGLGLGLALAREISEEHRGSIVVERNSHGGARFIVRLPLTS